MPHKLLCIVKRYTRCMQTAAGWFTAEQVGLCTSAVPCPGLRSLAPLFRAHARQSSLYWTAARCGGVLSAGKVHQFPAVICMLGPSFSRALVYLSVKLLKLAPTPHPDDSTQVQAEGTPRQGHSSSSGNDHVRASGEPRRASQQQPPWPLNAAHTSPSWSVQAITSEALHSVHASGQQRSAKRCRNCKL